VYPPRELTGLEEKQAEITRPPDLDLPPSAQLPREDVVFIPHVSLQAILVLDSPDVDLRLWNETVAEMEASGKQISPRPGAERGDPHSPPFMPRCGGSPSRPHGCPTLQLINEFFIHYIIIFRSRLGVLGGT